MRNDVRNLYRTARVIFLKHEMKKRLPYAR